MQVSQRTPVKGFEFRHPVTHRRSPYIEKLAQKFERRRSEGMKDLLNCLEEVEACAVEWGKASSECLVAKMDSSVGDSRDDVKAERGVVSEALAEAQETISEYFLQPEIVPEETERRPSNSPDFPIEKLPKMARPIKSETFCCKDRDINLKKDGKRLREVDEVRNKTDANGKEHKTKTLSRTISHLASREVRTIERIEDYIDNELLRTKVVTSLALDEAEEFEREWSNLWEPKL